MVAKRNLVNVNVLILCIFVFCSMEDSFYTVIDKIFFWEKFLSNRLNCFVWVKPLFVVIRKRFI